MKILLLDNYDSFTYNLHHYLSRFCTDVQVFRNDEISIDACANFSHIVLSPGPGLPQDAGILMGILKNYAHSKPLLGVCLGMQAIALHYGGTLYNLPDVKHGVTIQIAHSENHIFKQVPQQTEVGLYHSWAVNSKTLPTTLSIEATSSDGVVMAIKHKELPVYGVQFHPESILTPHGLLMIQNWLSVTL